MSLSPGVSMGQATGTITLNTAQLAQAVQTARNLANQLNQAMNSAGSGANKVNSGFAQLTTTLHDLRGELLAIGAGAGLLTKIGLEGALNLRNYTIAFRQFVGSQKEAEDVTNSLIKLANKYGLEFEGVEQLGRALLPSLKGGTKELERWGSMAARLRSLFPAAPRGSETIAIQEFLAGQNTSLMRRFNIPLSDINEATAKFEDLGDALDFILTKRGATEEAAVAMANSFVSVRNELVLLLAQGFTPLFQALQPILASFREFLSQLRETQPGLVTAGAGFVAFAAAGAPALLLLNQMIIAGEKLKALGILGGLGKAGVGVAAAAVGATIGVGVVNAVGNATGNKTQQNFGLGDAWENLKRVLFNIAWTLTKAFQGIVELFARFTNMIGGPIDTVVGLAKRFGEAVMGMIRAAGDFISGIASLIPAGMGGDSLRSMAAGLFGPVTATSKSGADALASSEDFRKKSDAWLLNLANSMNPPAGADDSKPVGTGGGGGPDMSERNKAINDWARSAARIEREAGQARLDAVRDYERSVAQTVAQYNLSALREEEDFQRGRARAIADFNRQVADMQEEAAKRDARAESDYGEKVAEMREDSTDRLTELEEDYAKNRERAARDHRDRLMDAAARLDAVAVRDEQRNFARQQQDAQENYDDQRSEIQKALDERIADELKAHQRRLEDSRAADAERLADMQQAFAEQTAQEDFERAIRLQRQAEDHAQQLSEMAVAQSERLAQISQQAAEERAALNESFTNQLNDMGIYSQSWRDIQAKQQAESLKQFDIFWKEFKGKFPTTGVPTTVTDILDYSTDAGPGRNVPAGRAASGGSVSNKSITVAEGAIVINAAPGQDEEAIGRVVDYRLRRILEEAAR